MFPTPMVSAALKTYWTKTLFT